MSTKTCTRCGQDKPQEGFKPRKLWCADCRRVYHEEWRSRPDIRDRQKLHRERNKLAGYGLEPADYQMMLDAQKGACAICAGGSSAGRQLAVDHDHVTGVARALLCSPCNFLVGRRENGLVKSESLAALVDDYLARFGTGNPVLGQGVGLGPLPPRRRVRVEKPKNRDWAAKKLTREQVAQIRRRVTNGEARRALAREFGVASSTVIRIVSGQLWPDA